MTTNAPGPMAVSERAMFAWLPVLLAEYQQPFWYRTGRRAWLCKVTRIETMWGDVFYRRVK